MKNWLIPTESKVSPISQKYTFLHTTPLNKSLRMVHVSHKNHKNSIWKWSGLHLKNWLSSKNTKNPIKTEKNRNFKKPSRVSLGIAQIHKCTKFHKNRTKTVTAGPMTNFIRQTHRRQRDRQNFYCSFSVLGVQNVQKKVSAQSEEK